MLAPRYKDRMEREAPPERERDLDLVEDAPAPPAPARTVRATCPVCKQVRVAVCRTCGVDVETGELVAPPAPTRLSDAPLPEERAARDAAALAWGLRDVLDRSRRSVFGTLLAMWLIFSLQTGPTAIIAVGSRGDGGEGGALALTTRLLGLFLLAYVLVARARGVLRGSPPFDLEDLGGAVARAALLLVALAPCLAGPAPTFAVAAALPLLLGAVASERPLLDLTPAALAAAARRSEGLLRATLLSTAALGPALLALPVESALAVWRPVVLVLGATIAGTAAGLARRAAEAR